MNNSKPHPSFFKSIALNNRAWAIWWNLCPGLFLSAFLSCTAKALIPYVSVWLGAHIITELAGSQNPHAIIRLALAHLLFSSILAFLNALLKRVRNYHADSAARLYSKIYMDKMFSMDFERIDSQATYNLYSQIMQNEKWSCLGIHETVSLFEKIVSGSAKILGGVFLTVPLVTSQVSPESKAFAFLSHPACAVVLAVLMFLMAAASSSWAGKAQNYWIRYAASTRFGNRLADFYMSAARDRKRALDMRIYGQQENVSKPYMERNNPFGPSSPIARQAKGPMGLWAALSQSVSALLTAAVYLFVCLKARVGAFGLGEITLYTGALAGAFTGITLLSDALGRMAANGSFLESAYRFLDIPNTMYQGSLTTEKRSDGQYEICFRDVSFCYPGTKDYVLSHINMSFPIGSRLALVGMNGSGKTTFIKLLCRLYDPTEGEILLNGIDIRKYKYDEYIRLFSVVFQDFKLFALPLGENLAGSAWLDQKKASLCLEKAGFTGWETVMPHGLSTYLYRDLDGQGIELSGGEAQKTAIARALYKDAPFIILDEPTAALDPIAEAGIYEAFGSITAGRTSVCISHRLSSCRFCDEIVVFHKGTIVQKGTHDQLLEDREGTYYELWNAQAQYYR